MPPPQIPLIAIELLIGFGVPLAWGVGQLISLRREKARGAAKAAEQVREASPESTDADQTGPA